MVGRQFLSPFLLITIMLIIPFTHNISQQFYAGLDSTKTLMEIESLETDTIFKPQRIIYEIGAGILTGGACFLITSLPFLLIDDVSGKDFVTVVFAAGATGMALGYYFAASKYNKDTHFPYYLAASMATTFVSGLIVYHNENGYLFYTIIPVMSLFQISSIQVKFK